MLSQDLEPSFNQHMKRVQDFGAKAAGLTLLPNLWVPTWTGLELKFFDEWLQTGTLSSDATKGIMTWIADQGVDTLILRTSGQNETIKDRGKYQSVRIKEISELSIKRAIEEIYQRSHAIDPDDRMGIVAQKYVNPVLIGHLSNESRVSPTRNQWRYDLEDQSESSKGLNSKYANSPNPANALVTKGSPHQLLRSIAHWCELSTPVRCHLEWVSDGKNLYIVQLDLDWPQLDRGIDPRTAISSVHPIGNLESRSLEILKLFEIGSETRWKKLRNLSEFDFIQQAQAPRLYQLEADRLLKLISDESQTESLLQEILHISADKAVVRTEVDQDEFARFNLPRTDTVKAIDAITWCREALETLQQRGAAIENIAFLFHGFIPSLSSAWAYAEPNGNYVQVDALWGLPDGIQVLPHDTYEVVTAQNKIIQTNSTFKPMFLAEKDDGSWEYLHVLGARGRSQVLSRSDIFEVASRTQEIANRIGETAQIMWFCQIPSELNLGRNLPWFRSREFHQYTDTSKGQFREYVVKNHHDLDSVPTKQVALVYQPDPTLIRSDAFLDLFISKATNAGHPVKLYGSSLGHVYYRLSQAGVPVILANAARYERARDRKLFGKLVRDLIPAKILSGGEAVREGQLSAEDLPSALCGKMFEEVEEFLRSESHAERIAELSDMYEIICGLAGTASASIEDIIAQADKKRSKLGGFELGRVLLETSLNSKNYSSDTGRVPVKLQELYRPVYGSDEITLPLARTLRAVAGGQVMLKHLDLDITIQASLSEGNLKLKFLKLPSRPALASDQKGFQLSFLPTLDDSGKD